MCIRDRDPLERARLAKVFEQGLDNIIGHVLPVSRTPDGRRWQSGPWFLRSERCYLVPGDSPIGYRLPLDSQPWAASGDYPFIHAPDQSRAFATLPRHADIRRQFRERDAARAPLTAAQIPATQESAGWLTRTSMCAEPRGGVLYLSLIHIFRRIRRDANGDSRSPCRRGPADARGGAFP